MTRTVFINGRYCIPEDATVSIFDRGLLFGDAIYEVVPVIDSRLVDFDVHLQRLDRSLREMKMTPSMSHHEILAMMRELVTRNSIDEGLVYMQITRGSDGDRDFLPSDNMSPTIFAFTQHTTDELRDEYLTGIKIRSAPDIRWARRDIKTVNLMGSVLSKWDARNGGGAEVLMHQDGYVTECGATSFYIVKANVVITRPLSNDILPGCTRRALLDLIATKDITLEERLFTLDEVYAADETFITGSSAYVCPVLQVDETVIGDGTPGPVTKQLFDLYMMHSRRDAI